MDNWTGTDTQFDHIQEEEEDSVVARPPYLKKTELLTLSVFLQHVRRGVGGEASP